LSGKVGLKILLQQVDPYPDPYITELSDPDPKENKFSGKGTGT